MAGLGYFLLFNLILVLAITARAYRKEITMNITAAWRSLWTKVESDIPQLSHESWSGSRLAILLAIAGLAVAAHLGHELLSEHNMTCLTVVATAYIIGNTITKAMTVYWNGKFVHNDQTAKLAVDVPAAKP